MEIMLSDNKYTFDLDSEGNLHCAYRVGISEFVTRYKSQDIRALYEHAVDLKRQLGIAEAIAEASSDEVFNLQSEIENSKEKLLDSRLDTVKTCMENLKTISQTISCKQRVEQLEEENTALRRRIAELSK